MCNQGNERREERMEDKEEEEEEECEPRTTPTFFFFLSSVQPNLESLLAPSPRDHSRNWPAGTRPFPAGKGKGPA